MAAVSVTSRGHRQGVDAQRWFLERAPPGKRRGFRPWSKGKCSDLLIQYFFPRRHGTERERDGGCCRGVGGKRCPVQWKCLQNLGLRLTPGSKEVHEQVSLGGKDSPMLYFMQDVSPFLSAPQSLLLPQKEAEAGLSAGVVLEI